MAIKSISLRRIDRETIADLTEGENKLQEGMWGFATDENVLVIRTLAGDFRFLDCNGLNIIGTFADNPPAEGARGDLCIVNGYCENGIAKDGVLFQWKVDKHEAAGWKKIGCVQGPKGDKGDKGIPFTIKGRYQSKAELMSAHPEGQAADFYFVGIDDSDDLFLYIWDEEAGDEGEWAKIKANLRGRRGLKGYQGDTPAVGGNGNWHIGAEDTGYGAVPYIDPADGKWYVGTTATGVEARGKKGDRGEPGGGNSYFVYQAIGAPKQEIAIFDSSVLITAIVQDSGNVYIKLNITGDSNRTIAIVLFPMAGLYFSNMNIEYTVNGGSTQTLHINSFQLGYYRLALNNGALQSSVL